MLFLLIAGASDTLITNRNKYTTSRYLCQQKVILARNGCYHCVKIPLPESGNGIDGWIVGIN